MLINLLAYFQGHWQKELLNRGFRTTGTTPIFFQAEDGCITQMESHCKYTWKAREERTM